jgi:hypothetical protein
MMMAHDSTPNRPELSAASVEALRSALRECLEQSGETSALQPALRQITIEARAKKMHAEQLLVILKDIWFALPHIGNAPNEQQNRLLQRVITLCIREYYSS